VFLNDEFKGTTTEPTYILKNLIPFSTNKITIRAKDTSDNVSLESNSVEVKMVDTTAPSIPLGLKASNVNANGFLLTWSPSTDSGQIDGYEVYILGNSQPVLVTEPMLTLNALNEYTTYSLTVIARDSAGNRSASSQVLDVRTLDSTKPTAPTEVKTTGTIEKNKFSIAWNPSTDNVGITSYEVYLNNKSLGRTEKSSFDATGLMQATNYSVKVVAYDASGNRSADSQLISVQTLATLIVPAPIDLKVVNSTASSFDLVWKAVGDATVSAFELYVNNKLFRTMKATDRKTSLSGLSNYTSYNVKLRALSKSGESSAFSSAINVRTLDRKTPTIPSGLKVAGLSGTMLRLTWTTSIDESGISSYEVYADGLKIGTSKTVSFDWKIKLKKKIKFQVLAIDNFSNKSALGVTVTHNHGTWLDVRGKSVFLDGKLLKLSTGTSAVMRNGILYVPYRPVFDALGLKTSVDAKTKVITATRTGYKVTLTNNSKTYRVNNSLTKSLLANVYSIGGTVMIPAKFFEQEFKIKISYMNS
jgi:chitodextrinase